MLRNSNVHLFFLTEVIHQKDVPWLQGEKLILLNLAHSTFLDADKNVALSIIARLMNILINILFVELQNTFYITENKSNEIQFYHKLDWKHLTDQHTGRFRTKYFKVL